MYSEIIQADGHLVDSQILSKIFDRTIACGSEFEAPEQSAPDLQQESIRNLP